ncbi:MAG: hypothetical protein RLP14_01565 [Owenweeksia sp.]
MKKFICALALLSPLFTFSQASGIAVDWGPLTKSKDLSFYTIIGSDGTSFYTFGMDNEKAYEKIKEDTYHVKKYHNQSFKTEYDVVYDDFEYKGEPAIYKHSWLRGNTPHLFFTVYNSDLDKKFLILSILDEKGRKKPPIEIASVKAKRRSDGAFNISTSQDSSKVLIYAEQPYLKGEPEKLGLTVLDHEYNLLWEKMVTLPYTDRYFDISDWSVTNTGDIFIAGYATPNRRKGERRERDSPNEDYKLFQVSKDKEDILEYELGLNDKYVSSTSVLCDFDNNTMVITGFYSDKNVDRVGGTYFITINQNTLEPIIAINEPFTKEFLLNFLPERRVEKNHDLYNYKFRDFIRRDDGGVMIVAEQYYKEVISQVSSSFNGVPTGVQTADVYYYRNDIIVLNISPSGSVDWASHIPKEQASVNDGGFFSSYLLLVEKNRLNFIFNDNPKNLDRLREGKRLRGMGSPLRSTAIIATVDENGKVTREAFFKSKEVSATLVPGKSHQINYDSALLYGMRKSKSRFGVMKFR